MAVNENSGALFRNDRKQTDNHPDYKGSVTIDGKEFWVSGWKKRSKNTGDGFLSLAFTAKEVREQPASQPPQERSDDIPF